MRDVEHKHVQPKGRIPPSTFGFDYPNCSKSCYNMTMKILEELSYSHFEEMAALEREFYSDDNITPPGEAYNWYKRCPYSVIAAAENGVITGFINLFPVSEAVFEGLKAGIFCDKDLKAENITDIYATDEPLHMFLSCIAVRPEYRKSGLTSQLILKAIEQYATVAHRCDFIITDNVTHDGMRFSLRYGFEPLCPSQHGSMLHIQKYSDFCTNAKAKGIL